jgi:hypothetical protein
MITSLGRQRGGRSRPRLLAAYVASGTGGWYRGFGSRPLPPVGSASDAINSQDSVNQQLAAPRRQSRLLPAASRLARAGRPSCGRCTPVGGSSAVSRTCWHHYDAPPAHACRKAVRPDARVWQHLRAADEQRRPRHGAAQFRGQETALTSLPARRKAASAETTEAPIAFACDAIRRSFASSVLPAAAAELRYSALRKKSLRLRREVEVGGSKDILRFDGEIFDLRKLILRTEGFP